MIDGIDKAILNILQQDGRISNADIARQINLAPSAVLERIRKLEERKVIRGYSADIDRTIEAGVILGASWLLTTCEDPDLARGRGPRARARGRLFLR